MKEIQLHPDLTIKINHGEVLSKEAYNYILDKLKENQRLKNVISDVTATTADWRAEYTNKPASNYVQGQIDILRRIEKTLKKALGLAN